MRDSADPRRSVRLTAAQRTYLDGAAFLGPDLRDIIVAGTRSAGGGITLELDGEIAERFRSILTEQLAEFGFDPAYQLTIEGVMLEQLIDAFFIDTEKDDA